ncbi:MAG: hypothetical protein DRI56_10510 [Chloroflexota bacterium]|nr:MAG: hypothetical protein DRI56_10510 [Chloroflexota bacterium]
MSKLLARIQRGFLRLRLHWRLFRLNYKVAAHSRPASGAQSVVFFNASARLRGLNLNAAFSMLTSWGVQLSGARVLHFACRAGMKQCVLGAGLGDPAAPPPCRGCVADTRRFTGSAPTVWFDYQADPELQAKLEPLSVEEMKTIVHCGRPLGELALPSLRWILRRHHLEDDAPTRHLYQAFILSAHNVAQKFDDLLSRNEPSVVVVFNGLQYPEAAARWVAQQRGIRVITHEVSFQPFSAFFTVGHATAYPIHLPDEFELTDAQNERLDAYLSQRFQGEFTMAGIRFWPEMRGLDESFLEQAKQFKQIVPVFTNVIFDTSQLHANTVFSDMFAWLETVTEIAAAHPETLFVIRAHPDEMREGKESRESVEDWVRARGVEDLPNVVFVGPNEPLSSYELIRRAKFVMVYNSSIGLEATLLGAPVLCGGQARYTQYPTVFFPVSPMEYAQRAGEFLGAERIEIPAEFLRNARRFLYYQLYKVSLPFERYLKVHPSPGYVQLKRFSWRELLPERSAGIRAVVNGIVNGDEFIL